MSKFPTQKELNERLEKRQASSSSDKPSEQPAESNPSVTPRKCYGMTKLGQYEYQLWTIENGVFTKVGPPNLLTVIQGQMLDLMF